jgi:hypothetical protein
MSFMKTCCSWTRSALISGQFSDKFRAHGNWVSIGLTFQQREHFLDSKGDVKRDTSGRPT